MMNNDKPPYFLASEALKHLKNKNYGLLEVIGGYSPGIVGEISSTTP